MDRNDEEQRSTKSDTSVIDDQSIEENEITQTQDHRVRQPYASSSMR
jgi:hypothetical protein